MHGWTLCTIAASALLLFTGLGEAADATSPDAAAMREVRVAQNQALLDQDLD
jgi:hypothetical protein